MPGSHLSGNHAGFTLGDAAQRVGSGECSEVRCGRRPAGQRGGLRQEQHRGHGKHDHHSESCCQNCARTPLAAGGHGSASSRREPSCHLPPFPSVRLPADSAVGVSLRVEARAVSVHGMEEPKGPPTRSVTVRLNQPPSAATEAEAVPPARVLTVLSTAAGSSPLAKARAPARAPSSILSWVTPAAAPVRSSASKARTAGRVTANSAVTAPREEAVLRRRTTVVSGSRAAASGLVTAMPVRFGSASAGSLGPHRCAG